jgi:hypothetical protein
MKTLVRTVLLLILSLSALPLLAQDETGERLDYRDSTLQFDYPADLELIESGDLIQLNLDIDNILIHILHDSGFENLQSQGYSISPDQSPLEMMRELVALLNSESPEYVASLESVREISLSDGRVALLLDTQVQEYSFIYALSLPLTEGQSWLMAVDYPMRAVGAASQNLLLAIAETLQPAGSDESALPAELSQQYIDESIQFRFPAGMRLEKTDEALTLRTEDVELGFLIINPTAFATLREEGLELDPAMTPQQLMIGFVRAIHDMGEDSISLEAVREASLADGRSIMILRHHFPEDMGTIILLTLPLNDELSTLAGVFISETPPFLNDLILPEAEKILFGMIESLQLVSP